MRTPHRRRTWIGALLLLALAGLGLILLLPRQQGEPFDARLRGMIEENVTYCVIDGVALKMDVYYPDSPGPWGAVIFVHGGGWIYGDKHDLMFVPADSGYLVASINYRLNPDYQFPAMIKDVRCAVRSLRAHAREYNIDPRRIAVVGHSAGGQLAALAGLADRRAGWDVGPYREWSSRVQALVLIGTPADLGSPYPVWVEQVIASTFSAEDRVSGSPVQHASRFDPPVLILHGEEDWIVPLEQAYLMQEALLAAHVPVELHIVAHGGHSLEAIAGQATLPSAEEIDAIILDFLFRTIGEGR